jgi:hypothetical protein
MYPFLLHLLKTYADCSIATDLLNFQSCRIITIDEPYLVIRTSGLNPQVVATVDVLLKIPDIKFCIARVSTTTVENNEILDADIL